MAMTEAEVEGVVREVTDDEVAHYAEFGWVFMPRLVVSPLSPPLPGLSAAERVGCAGPRLRGGAAAREAGAG